MSGGTLSLLLEIIRSAGLADRPDPDPEGWTFRDEANVLTVAAFRHGFLEQLHGGKDSPLLEDPTLKRITNREMKRLMIETSARLADLLRMRAEEPAEYARVREKWRAYCDGWERHASTVTEETAATRWEKRSLT